MIASLLISTVLVAAPPAPGNSTAVIRAVGAVMYDMGACNRFADADDVRFWLKTWAQPQLDLAEGALYQSLYVQGVVASGEVGQDPDICAAMLRSSVKQAGEAIARHKAKK